MTTNHAPFTSPRAIDTLDPERIDQLATFLTIEAAASSATAVPQHRRRTGRRLAVGVAAAAILSGALFTAGTLTDAPGPGRTAPAGASPVRIVREGDQVTVSILDPGASVDAIAQHLADAGVKVRVVDLDGHEFDDPSLEMLVSPALDSMEDQGRSHDLDMMGIQSDEAAAGPTANLTMLGWHHRTSGSLLAVELVFPMASSDLQPYPSEDEDASDELAPLVDAAARLGAELHADATAPGWTFRKGSSVEVYLVRQP